MIILKKDELLENNPELIAFIGKLEEWKRSFIDSVLAEKSAIALYTSQLKEFLSDFNIKTDKNFSVIEYENLSESLQKMNLSKSVISKIISAFKKISTVSHGSIKKIIEEEEEHKREFTKMIAMLHSIKENVGKKVYWLQQVNKSD